MYIYSAYDKRALRAHLERKQQLFNLPAPSFHQDVLYVALDGLTVIPDDELAHEVFYFDYGCVVMWGMSVAMEQDVCLLKIKSMLCVAT